MAKYSRNKDLKMVVVVFFYPKISSTGQQIYTHQGIYGQVKGQKAWKILEAETQCNLKKTKHMPYFKGT